MAVLSPILSSFCQGNPFARLSLSPEGHEQLRSVVSAIAQQHLPIPILAHAQGCTRHIINLTSLSLQELHWITDVASHILSGCTSGLSILGGAMIMSVAKDKLKAAYHNFKQAEDSIAKRLGCAELANQSLYFATGSTLLAHGVAKAVMVASHYAAFSDPMAQTVAHVLGGPIIGGIFIFRGTLLAGRALYHLNKINKFKIDFNNCLKDKTGMHLLLNNIKNNSQLEKIIGPAAKTKLMKTDLNQINDDLLKEIDKGMYKEEMKQKIMVAIGILMVLIGISAIVFSGGYALIAILLFMAIAGTQMDTLIMLINTSSTLNDLIDARYEKTRALQFQQELDKFNLLPLQDDQHVLKL